MPTMCRIQSFVGKEDTASECRGWGASVMTAPGCGGGDGPLYLPGNQPSPQEKNRELSYTLIDIKTAQR